jgi:trigger factor
LKIEKEIQDDHQAKLIVEVDQDQMEASKHRAARKMAGRGKIPGFRPGKAPYPVIVRYYGEQAITEQAMDELVDEIYPKVLEEAGVNPAAPGSLESIDNLEPPKLTFRVPLAPEVDLGDYHSIRLPYEWVAPGEKEVDAALEDLRQMYASTETVDREVQVGDYVLIDVKGRPEEIAEGDQERSAALSRTGFATFVRQEARDQEWPYKGFNKELVGLKAGEEKTVKYTYPEDDTDEALHGRSVNFDLTVRTVRSVILPDLDDDFAKMTGAGESMDSLRETIRKDVENRARADYDDKYFVELIEKIKEGATLKYAPQTLEHEGEHVLEDLQQRLGQQGLDLQTYFKMRNTTQEKFVEEEVQPVAKKRLERSLILDQIIRDEKISVDNTSLDAEFNNTLTELQMQGMDLGQVRGGQRGQQRVAEAVAMESASRLLTRRALDTLKAIAIGEYKPPEEREAATPPEEEAVSEPEASVSEAPSSQDVPEASPSEPSAEE